MEKQVKTRSHSTVNQTMQAAIAEVEPETIEVGVELIDSEPYYNPKTEQNPQIKPKTQSDNAVLLQPESISEEQAISNISEINKDFDPGYAYSITKRILSYINKYYFRVEFIGFDELPKRNNPDHPLIYASNHSGMAFPWDAISFTSGLFAKTGFDMTQSARALTAPALSRTHIMSPFLIDNFWKRLGAIDATRLNFEAAMHYKGANVMIYPEGVPGIAKGYNNKYQLQRLATSSLRMSIKYKTDIIPFATVNGEYINPFSYSIAKLNDLVQKLGIPFLPIGPALFLIPFQPWLFYFAFPAKLTFVRGKRIKPYELVGNRPLEEVSEEEIQELRDKLQQQMQRELDAAVAKYGKKPYDLWELMRVTLSNASKIMHFIPLVWPILFREHERQYTSLRDRMDNMGILPKDDADRIRKMQEVHEARGEQEVTVLSVVDTVLKNPEILLLYTPVVGLISMFRGDD
ncbi:glycerol acyltransferase [Limibacter armeniacum]|uniref:glycerol acyltransferase n=1 Tax=Limibacter armeniacum TaxID=466084 RepID=UPI002FE62D2D